MTCTGVEIAPLVFSVFPFATAYMTWADNKKQTPFFNNAASDEQDIDDSNKQSRSGNRKQKYFV
jgi:hypothetical protein